jgi:hypothetical protein
MVHAHAAEESDVLLRSQSRNRDRVREKQRRGHARCPEYGCGRELHLRSDVIDPVLSSPPVRFRDSSSFMWSTHVRRMTHPASSKLRGASLRLRVEESRVT